MMGSVIHCCMGCVAPKRYPGCHDHCPEYRGEKADYEARKAIADAQKSINNGLDSQTIKAVYKAHKRMRGG